MPETRIYPVVRRFRDRLSGERYLRGDQYKTTSESRARELMGRRVIGSEPLQAIPAPEPADDPTEPENGEIDGAELT